jgi:hypothetical protein
MKLRLLGNKIRFRLSEPEVYALSSVHQVQAALSLNPVEKDNFRYTITCDKLTFTTEISFKANELKVHMPLEKIKAWSDTDSVGIEETVLIGTGEQFVILIEKDFKCLSDREEDESKLFPNPKDQEGC